MVKVKHVGGTIAFWAPVTWICLCLSGCGTFMDAAHFEIPFSTSKQSTFPYFGEDVEVLVERVPKDASTPVVSFFGAATYVNITAVTVSWCNPTDRVWTLAPRAERLCRYKGRNKSENLGAATGSLSICTRVTTADQAWVRYADTETLSRFELKAFDGSVMDDESAMWPGVKMLIARKAEHIKPAADLVLPPHSSGYINSLFPPAGSKVEYVLTLTSGADVLNYDVLLEYGRDYQTVPLSMLRQLNRFPKEEK